MEQDVPPRRTLIVREDATMSAELVERLTAPAVRVSHTQSAFASRSRLARLRDELIRFAKQLRRPRWNEPPVFFFDHKRQSELELARVTTDRFAHVNAMIADEMPTLLDNVEVRRVARAIGMKGAANGMVSHSHAARELAELLATPDDEVFLVLAPASRFGVRLHLRGAAEVSQLRGLLRPILNANDFQLIKPGAIQSDGTLPTGFAGCEHWLWPTQLLAGIPRVNGERIVLVGAVVVRATEHEPRFPVMKVESEIIETLTPFRAAAELSRLCGRVVPVQVPSQMPAVARAA